MEIEEKVHFSGKPRKFQEFHLKISHFSSEDEQVNTDPTLKQHLPWSTAVILLPQTPPGHKHGNKLEIRNKPAERRPKHTFDME